MFRIEVTTMATVTDDGAEAEHGGMDWDETSYAECANCLEHGKLSHFTAQVEAPPGSPPPAPTLLEALQQAVAALNTAPRFAVPSLDTDSYRIAALCDLAIAKAKGGAQ